ncbi:MAG: DUF1015 domain-containing protein [Fimbriimonadales bacterium]|nr:DUF1015 domain-containing protein [Fimbriimonadales bacterium]
MATVRAFRALRYARLIPEVVAPPYDVIDEGQRAQLASLSPHNIVHLTLPEGGEGRYQRAHQLLEHWLAEGVLQPDPEPALYRYSQQFTDPLTGSARMRTGYFVLLHTEPYERGVVLPHEQTFPRFKEDRFRLLEATRTHLEAIFGLYEPTPALQEALAGVLWEPIAHLEGDELPEGHQHRLERLTHPVAVARIERAFDETRIWIADGHHRYETALRFGQQYGSDGSPERFLPILLVPIDDPGLVILPTHRILSQLPPGVPGDWRARLEPDFDVQSASPDTLPDRVLASNGEAIGFLWREGAWLVRPRAFEPVAGVPDALTRLDAWWLHERLMPALGYGSVDIRYTRFAQEALDAVRQGEGAAAFLLSPPSIAALQQVAQAGGRMPHKSTYFYPKVLSGLVMWRVGR